MLICSLISCEKDGFEVSINADGYVVVDGVNTNILAEKEDVITLDSDGYITVNGVKTGCRVSN